MKTKFETIHCPLCGSDEFRLSIKAPDRFSIKEGEIYKIVSCATCNFIYLNPRPTAECISEFYSDRDYQPFVSTQSALSWWDRTYLWARKYAVRWKRHKIEHLKSTGRLLDIGCGTGEFLHEMKRHGWEVEGIEKDKAAAEYAKREYGLKVSTYNLDETKIKENYYDIITMWHVLEHLFQPLETLKLVQQVLKDEGWLLIAVPNISSFDARFYLNNWAPLDAPRHLQHFVPKSLKGLIETAELEVVDFQHMPLDACYNCLLSEFLILAQKPKWKVLQPFFLLRGVSIALISMIEGSRFINKTSGLGSSILYFVKKGRVL
ncbi:MAG: class I SAM-dependent methyltransferase [bacterium]